MKAVDKSKFFERRVPTSWMTAKTKEDVLDALIRLSDLELQSKAFIRPIGIINGSYDLLHASHLRLINECRWRSGTVVALLDSDTKVQRSKGGRRPIMSWGERASALFYSGCDYILEVGSDTDFLTAIEYLQPDFRVLGAEYQGKKSRLPHIHTVYTTERGPHSKDIIERILTKYGKNYITD